MKKIEAHKAQPVGNSTPEAVTIVIKDELPNLLNSDPDEVMAIEADRIARALWEALPGGTLDMLCAVLLQRQASRLRGGYRGGRR